MIKKLEWWLNDQMYNKDVELADGSFIQTDDIDPESVSDLLEMIEEAGMLPPPKELEMDEVSFEYSIWTLHYPRVFNEKGIIDKWEPEDGE